MVVLFSTINTSTIQLNIDRLSWNGRLVVMNDKKLRHLLNVSRVTHLCDVVLDDKKFNLHYHLVMNLKESEVYDLSSIDTFPELVLHHLSTLLFGLTKSWVWSLLQVVPHRWSSFPVLFHYLTLPL